MEDQPPQLKFSESILSNEPIELSDNEYVTLLKPIPSPSLFLQVKIALSKNLINKEVFMKLCIHSASDERHLGLMGLVLREKLDPNIYYMKKENQIHVIPYIYMVLYKRDPDICYKVSRLFIAAGSDITRNSVFQNNNISVKDWLDKEYPDRQIDTNLFDNSEETILHSVFLDRPDLLKGIGENLLFSKSIIFHADAIFHDNFSLNKVLKSGSSEECKDLNDSSEIGRKMIDSLVDICVKYLNVKAIRYFLENKYIPSYLLINNVIVYLKYYRQKNYLHALSEVKEILDVFFEFGSKIDSFQADMIRTIDIHNDDWFHSSNQLRSISGGDNPEKKLKFLMKYTSIQYTNSNNINLWKIHHEINSEISRTLNRNNIDADLNTNLYIAPPIQLDEDIDRCLDILIHSDENKDKWYISSGVFDSIRERGSNPYTGEKILSGEMCVLSQKRSTIKRFGILTSLRSSDVDDLIIENKSVIDNNTNQIITAFGKLCKLNNIKEDLIDRIPVKYLQRILDELSNKYEMPSSELKYLNHAHGIVTFKRIVMATVRFFPENSSIIFGYIKLAISRKT